MIIEYFDEKLQGPLERLLESFQQNGNLKMPFKLVCVAGTVTQDMLEHFEKEWVEIKFEPLNERPPTVTQEWGDIKFETLKERPPLYSDPSTSIEEDDRRFKLRLTLSASERQTQQTFDIDPAEPLHLGRCGRHQDLMIAMLNSIDREAKLSRNPAHVLVLNCSPSGIVVTETNHTKWSKQAVPLHSGMALTYPVKLKLGHELECQLEVCE